MLDQPTPNEAELDELEQLLRDRKPPPPFPRHLQVPEIKIRLEWPYFEDSYIENPNRPDHVVSDIESLWQFRMLEPGEKLDSTDFWGPTADFWLEGESQRLDLYRGETDHPMIAIANFRLIETRWKELLPKLEIATFPPPNVMLVMAQEALGGAGVDAWQRVYHQKDNVGAIRLLEDRLQEAVSLLHPTMHMFLSSIWAHRGRPDPPTEKDADQFVGPYSETNWVTIFGISDRTFRTYTAPNGRWRKHPSSAKGRIYLFRRGLPPDTDDLISKFELKRK